MTRPPAAPTLHPSPDTCIHGKVCMALNDYLQGVLMSSGNASVIRCLDVMHLGEGCPHYTSTPDADARQRIEDVIKTLEKDIAEQNDLIEHTTGHHKEVHESIFNALEYSLALLNDGVERK